MHGGQAQARVGQCRGGGAEASVQARPAVGAVLDVGGHRLGLVLGQSLVQVTLQFRAGLGVGRVHAGDGLGHAAQFGGFLQRTVPQVGLGDAHVGGPFGRGPMFGGGRGRRRRGDVRASLLLLLAEEPRNGYQLMQAIEELSGGRWRPRRRGPERSAAARARTGSRPG